MCRAPLRLTRLAMLTLSAVWMLVAAMRADAQSPRGEPHVADARAILPAELILGNSYRIDPRVIVDGYDYVYTLHTPFGELQARGTAMLEQKIRELTAISQAAVLIDDEAALQNATRAARSLPEEQRHAYAGADGYRLRPKSPFGALAKAYEPQQPLNALEREFAVRLGVDPESRNPVLHEMLRQLAAKERAGRLEARPAVSLNLPGMGLFGIDMDSRKVLFVNKTEDIDQAIAGDLAALGVDPRTQRELTEELPFTTWQRLVLMHHLRRLVEVPNAAALVEGIAEAETEAEALRQMQSVRMLANLNAQQPIAELSHHGLPVARTRDGKFYLLSPLDYVDANEDVEAALAAFRKAYPRARATFVSAGRISPEAGRIFRRHGIDVAENMRNGTVGFARTVAPNGTNLTQPR